jgi:hypothetical protein
MVQSVAEHQEVCKEDAAMMLVGGQRKRRRDRILGMGCHQKLKGMTQASCESRTVAGRGMTRCAGVAWLRRGVVRKDCTRGKVERATQRVGPLRNNLQTHHEGKSGTKDLGSKRWLYVWEPPIVNQALANHRLGSSQC